MSYTRLKNGKYKVVVSYPKSNGKYGRLFATANSLKEAKEKESLMIAQTKEETPYKVTFGALAREYLKSLEGRLRTTTILHYKNYINIHVLPYFEDSLFMKITIEELRRWRQDQINKGYALETLRKAKKAINTIVHFAEMEYNLSNPAFKKLETFKRDPNEVRDERLRFWTLSEFYQFERVIKEEIDKTPPSSSRYMTLRSTYMMVSICFYAGLRRGEANVLQLKDFHDTGAKSYLDIYRSVAQKAGKGMGYLITPPKSKMSIRKVPVPYALECIIRDHIRALSHIEGFNPEFYLVGGVQISPDETINKTFRLFQNKAMLPHVTMHEMRHSYATMLYNNGVPLHVIAKLMGHTITKVTELYSHTYDEALDNAVSVINDLSFNRRG